MGQQLADGLQLASYRAEYLINQPPAGGFRDLNLVASDWNGFQKFWLWVIFVLLIIRGMFASDVGVCKDKTRRLPEGLHRGDQVECINLKRSILLYFNL